MNPNAFTQPHETQAALHKLFDKARELGGFAPDRLAKISEAIDSELQALQQEQSETPNP